jgi:hypothetical protein
MGLMQINLRPYVTTGIVIAGASVLVTAPLTVPPSALSPSPVTVAVAPAAFADGLLTDFDRLFTHSGQSAQEVLTGAGKLPDHLAREFLAAVDHSTGAELPHVVGVLTRDLEIVGEEFGKSAANIGAFIGDLPADFVDFVHAAAANPANIPTLLTNALITTMTKFGDGALGPMVCLLRDTMPAPFGGYDGLIVQTVQKLMTVLPQPSDDLQVNSFGSGENSGVELKKVEPAQKLFNLVPPTNHVPPGLGVKDSSADQVEAPRKPRFNVFKDNPLADFGNRSTFGSADDGSVGTSVPRPGIVASVVQRLTHPPQLGSIVRNLLKPHDKETSSEPPSEPNPE